MKFKTLFLVAALFVAANAHATTYSWVTDTISEMGVYQGTACIYLSGGEVVLVDLSTDAGKAEWSTALSAAAQKKSIKVLQTDGTLLGGCNTGTNIKPHVALFMVN